MTDLATEPAANPRRWWALAAMVLAMLVVGLDSTVLNVALPTMSTQLGANNSQLQWISDAYIVVFAAMLLPAGLLGDRFGRKKVLLSGLVLFVLASIVGTLVSSASAVIAVRAVMGVGGAIIMPLTMSMLPTVFPRHEQPKAIGIWTASTALGMPLGPIVGGWLLQNFWWGSIFFLNVPTVALALVASALLLPESKDPNPRRLDLVGAALSIVGLAVFICGIIQGPSWGWGDGKTVAALAVGVLLLVALVLWELRSKIAMMDLHLFADRNFLWGTLGSTFISFALFGMLFVLPQYFQGVTGTDPIGTGVRIVPIMGGLLVAARISERLVARFSYRRVIPAGLLIMAASLLVGATTSYGDGYGFIVIWLLVAGLGTGLTMVPAMTAVMATLPRDRTGVGSSLVQTLRQVGSALGVALLGSLLASVYGAKVHTASLPSPLAHLAHESVTAGVGVAETRHDPVLLSSVRHAYLHGMDEVLLTCGILAVAAALLVGAFLPKRTETAVSPTRTSAPAEQAAEAVL
jgi:EmrB/QacA subfamily drug resistance transporter